MHCAFNDTQAYAKKKVSSLIRGSGAKQIKFYYTLTFSLQIFYSAREERWTKQLRLLYTVLYTS